jgi:hypothetical protein
MGRCCPRRGDPEHFHRNVGLLALFCMVAIAVFMGVSWVSSSAKPRHRKVPRHVAPTTSQDHESVPMPPGHLDRG